MDTLVSAIAQHGYSILFAIVLAEAIGLPVPAALALLVAGGASMHGPLNPVFTVAAALVAMMIGDTIMYLLGRWSGWWILGVICRLTPNPEGCIFNSAASFYKRGRTLLVFAKFIPGINTMAPPLAGSMNMAVGQFLGLDFLAALLYTGAFWGVGFVFSGFVGNIADAYSKFGDAVTWLFGAAVVVWVGYHAWNWLRMRKLSPVNRLSVDEIAARIDQVVIFDVRSHGYYEQGMERIQGSQRIEPAAIGDALPKLAADKEVVLYCTCYREFTSEKVARFVAEHGGKATVLTGGLRAWKKAGLPVEAVPESDVVHLPKFG